MEAYEKRTMKHLFQHSVENYAEKTALAMIDGDELTYEQLGDRVQTLCKILYKRGVVAGDRVAILSENRPEWGIVYFAITTIGAVAVPILPDFHANEVHHILRHSDAKAIFISTRHIEKLEDAQVESLDSIFLMDDFSIVTLDPDTRIQKLKDLLSEGRREYSKLKEAAIKMTRRIPVEIEEDDLASIIYTSGTTGHSKGVMLTHKNLIFDALATLHIQNVNENDRLVSILPMSHSYEFTIGFLIPMMRGAAVYYLDKPPVAKVLIPALAKIKPTMMLTVPLIIEKIFKTKIYPTFTKNRLMRSLYGFSITRKRLHRLAANKIYKMFGGKLHFYGIGGALLAPDVEQFLREGDFPYAIGYGLTETSPLIAGCNPRLTRYRSTGPAIPGVEVKIVDPHPQTGEGEIWVRGENVMKGYFKDLERTRQTKTEDGWFKTGDLGVLDEDGYLYIKGRLKNMLVGPSGENIYPEEIESIINHSDIVLESIVYDDSGQLTARVYLNYDELDKEFMSKKLSESQVADRIKEKLEDLRKYVNENVSSFSRLKKIIEQPEPFEKTPTQKIKRYLYTN